MQIKPSNPDENILLAVYGTLKSSHNNHNILGPNAKIVAKNVRVPGFSLYHLGWFPGVVRNDNGGGVICEIVEVERARLHVLDGYEGFSEGREEHSLFVREGIALENGTNFFLYRYNRPVRDTDTLIPSGLWEDYDGSVDKKTG